MNKVFNLFLLMIGLLCVGGCGFVYEWLLVYSPPNNFSGTSPPSYIAAFTVFMFGCACILQAVFRILFRMT